PAVEPAGPIRVLVVDDHALNRALIIDQLEALGYAADAVDDGVNALRQLRERRYDVVMTDLRMPGMDGHTLAARIRDEHAELPILAVTAGMAVDDPHRCRQSGIADVFVKPMSLAVIDQAIRRHVARAGDVPARAGMRADAGSMVTLEPLDADHHGILLRSSVASLETIRATVAGGDVAVALACLHSLKGAFAMIDEAEVMAACVRLEERGARGDVAEIDQALDELAALIDAALSRRVPRAVAPC
ncbi:response regulator, partial [Burkholderia sp. NFACC33-1]